MELSFEDIPELLRFIGSLDCAEVELRIGDVHLAVRRDGTSPPTTGEASVVAAAAPAPTAAPQDATELTGATTPATPTDVGVVAPSPSTPAAGAGSPTHEWLEREAAGDVVIVRSPMVGTFYAAKAPGEPPFVEVGSEVRQGDVVCLVEVMKLFHSVTAEGPGTVAAVLVDDAKVVEYMQPLLVIEAGT